MAGFRGRVQRHLDLRGKTWWFKMALPSDVRHHFGRKTARVESLHTGDVRIARERRDLIERETKDLISGIRSGTIIAPTMRAAEERGAIWRETLATLQRDPRAFVPIDDEFGFTPYDYARDAAEEEAERFPQKDRQRFEDALVGAVAVDDYLDAYLTEAALARKTTKERRALVKRFAAWCDKEGLKLPQIDRRTAGRYVTEHVAPLDHSTGMKHLGAVRGYWEYLRRRGYVDSDEAGNPWDRQLQPKRGRRAERGDKNKERPFTTDEMKRLLSGQPTSYGKPDPAMADMIRIGALSGMRAAEIAGLWVEECSGDVFDIQEAKTDAGARKVPIHPDLKEIVARRIKGRDGKAPLFEEFAGMPNAADTMGKRFNRYRVEQHVDDKREGKRRSLVNFHSFRRWFVTEAERAGQPENVVGTVVGHSEGKKKITFGVYSGGPSDEQKRACVEAVKLPVDGGSSLE